MNLDEEIKKAERDLRDSGSFDGYVDADSINSSLKDMSEGPLENIYLHKDAFKDFSKKKDSGEELSNQDEGLAMLDKLRDNISNKDISDFNWINDLIETSYNWGSAPAEARSLARKYLEGKTENMSNAVATHDNAKIEEAAQNYKNFNRDLLFRNLIHGILSEGWHYEDKLDDTAKDIKDMM